jgi:hypothetical protein
MESGVDTCFLTAVLRALIVATALAGLVTGAGTYRELSTEADRMELASAR